MQMKARELSAELEAREHPKSGRKAVLRHTATLRSPLRSPLRGLLPVMALRGPLRTVMADESTVMRESVIDPVMEAKFWGIQKLKL